MSKAIGITGSIASGKSQVSSYLINKGYTLYDADEITHHAYDKGTKVYEKVISCFDCLDDNKNIDRKKLGQIVFNDSSKKKVLEEIVHPYVIETMKKGIEESDDDLVFLDIPLLYEAGLEYLCDKIIVVYCNREIQCERLMKRNNISESEANHLIDLQMSLEEKKKRADFVIENNFSLEELYDHIEKVVGEIRNEIIYE